MILSMPAQAWLFLTTVMVGGAVGLFYDFFRVLRRTAPHKKWAVQVEDVLFWLAVTILVFYYMLHRNYGEIRPFTLLGMAVGAAFYFAAISPYVVKLAVALVEYVKKIISAVIGIVLLPLRMFFAFLSPPAKKVAQKAQKRLRTFGRYGKIKAQKATRNWKIIRKKV
ncbi:MAG: spore cortex biosynthesis protein YabQ [Defluviitaleaceae bacterium]|nr:spore cortex biosynthesis protein YabQ [Defluviitaleaceae bacterium]MCL2273295.1 spore cortex biosynthesis protein YabQ [Defluviitaleaceae bacterium]